MTTDVWQHGETLVSARNCDQNVHITFIYATATKTTTVFFFCCRSRQLASFAMAELGWTLLKTRTKKEKKKKTDDFLEPGINKPQLH